MASAHGAQESHHVTSTGIDNRKLAMWIFLASECLFFGTLLSVYLIFRAQPVEPREEIFDILLTSISTFVLLMSSLAVVLAVYGAHHNRPQMVKLWLGVTVVLGLIFLGFQVYEFRHFYQHYGLGLSTNQFGASFYMLTGFHGAHVAGGVIILGSMLLGTMRRNGLGRDSGLNVELGGLYWHFVDVVWIVIFTVVYLIP